MSSKAYSKEEREAIRIKLLEVALDMYSQNGIKQTRLIDILEIVGISKPFFYKFYPSVEEFIICAITYQWKHIDELINEVESHTDWSWQEKAYSLFNNFIDYKNNKILIMTQEEEVWVRKRLDDEKYQEFMTIQISFFDKLLTLWEIPKNKCDPQVLANLVLSMLVIYNSGKKALPFFYTEYLRETAHAQAQCIITYLESLKV